MGIGSGSSGIEDVGSRIAGVVDIVIDIAIDRLFQARWQRPSAKMSENLISRLVESL